MSQTLSEFDAKAAESGSKATERFKSSGKRAALEVPKERVSLLAREVLEAVYATIRTHKVTYDEYNALKEWLIGVGEDGEWPLFLDVWVEHVVEEVATEDRKGSKGTIEGPYYVPDSPEQPTPGRLPRREDEPGTELTWRGQIRGLDGSGLAGGTVEIWHADGAGFYSQYAPGLPEWNLRGTVLADEDGNFEIQTMRPAPYQIPTDGACGKLIAAAGWHAWRPAHIHVKVSAPGHQQITAQLYFPGDAHNDDDIASAVKPELILDPKPAADGAGEEMVYDFVLDPED
ncbi:Catechol 1,2-dioxygenase [Sinomonas atrocyanea]|uniref:Catechol 1,2-dioxygenase n=1 Tax=Sinomonas atrocyanea TaxID=37927 RepID=A0A126ZUI0_9MICC|nr:Catechol 1,2-dioxygenase [Sinomonas atrocyanea]GEB63846.1 catechol 1,2-dioxygenase [Sinomonas atrocyanea]GGG65290.1 catechol 1,2-dioxygenase [Sinomonas atrocyanea]